MTFADVLGSVHDVTKDFIDPNSPAGQPDATNRRVYGLLQQGQGWMGLQTLYGFANSGLSDDDIGALAEQMRQITVQGNTAALIKPRIGPAQAGLDYQAQATGALQAGFNAKSDLGPSPVAQQRAATSRKQRQLDTIKNQANQADDGWKHLFDDPVLQKHPSAGLALKRYLTGVLGPVPIGESDLTHIQKQLQLQGYGRDLQANGVMSPGWNAAQAQWKNAIYNRQIAGDKPGSISVKHALDALGALTPTSAWNALIGYANQLGGGARQLLGDVIGGSAQLGADVVDPHFWSTGQSNTQTGYDVNASVTNALGGDTTPAQVKRQFEDNGGLRLLEDVSNIIMGASVLGSVGKFAQAAGTELYASTNAEAGAALSNEAAFQGPGVIAKSLSSAPGTGNPMFPRLALGGVLGAGTTAAAGGTPGQIALGGAIGGGVGALSGTNVFDNIPVLARTGPIIDSLASGDGLYYRARELVHAPYTWVGSTEGASAAQGLVGSAARLGDTAFNQSLLLGAEARGLAQVQDYAGGNQSAGFSKAIENTHTIDTVNDAIKARLGFTVLGAHLAPSVDDLMFVFGGKGAGALKTAPSDILHAQVANVSAAATDALSEPGFAASIQRASAAPNKAGIKVVPTLHDLIDRAGGLDKYNEFYAEKVREHAIAFAAERILAGQNAQAGFNAVGNLSRLDRVQQLQAIEHELWQDPDKITQAITDLRAQAGGEEFTVRMKRDIALGSMRPKGPAGDISAYVDAKRFARENLYPLIGQKATEARIEPAVPTGVGTAENLPELFHGSSTRFTTNPSPGAGAGVGNLLGPGFYATDSLDVASQYMRKGKGTEPAVHSITWTGSQPPRILDAESAMSSGLASTLRDWAHTIFEDNTWADISTDQLDEMNRVLDDNGPLTQFIASLRRGLVGNERGTADEVMDSLSARLEQQGYDALRYAGGARTGGQPHQAFVFLDPSQVTVEHIGPHTIASPDTAANRVLLNASDTPGSFGLAGKDTLSRQLANIQINDLESRWNDLEARRIVNPNAPGELTPASLPAIVAGKPSLDEYHQWESDAFQFLHKNFGVSGQDMPEHGAQMLPKMRDFAKLLGTDILAHPDAPQFVHDQLATLKGMGYKLMSGTDIGHAISDPSLADPLEGPLGFQRRLVEHAGLNPTVVPDANLSAHQWTNSIAAIQSSVDHGRYALPPGMDGASMMAYLRARGVIEEPHGTLVSVLQGLGARRLAKDLDISIADAQNELNSFPVQFRDTARSKVVDALSGPTSGRRFAEVNPGIAAEMNRQNPDALEAATLAAKNPNGFALPPMSELHAQRFYQDMVSAAVPDAYYAGASRLEDLFRAGMGFAGTALPDNKLGFAMANLPNRLIQLRNDLRFDLSPAFSFRRWFKSGVKGALEGIPPVWDPVKAMQDAGTFQFSRDTYERLRPGVGASLDYLDDASRYLRSQDVFGLYNGAMTEARAAGIWAAQGKTDEEINRLLVKTFEYGSGDVAGRSALERSTNFVFFPFSFEKTLYRNLGNYLLDAPAQRLVLTRGLAAYDEFNRNHMDGSNPLATSFYADHLPLLQEAAQLNAFAHGISPGEPGGVNRPLLNLFLPQSWSASPNSLSLLNRLVPAAKDFQRILAESQDQATIGIAAYHNAVADLRQDFGDGGIATHVPGGKWGSAGPRASTLTVQKQLEAGFAMELKWKQDNAKYLDYNAQSSDPTDKYRFPMDPQWGKYAGEPITPAAIRDIVHYKYPAYKPEAAITFATANNAAWNTYVLDSKGERFSDGKSKPTQLRAFAKAAADLGRSLASNSQTSAELAARTDQIRRAAAFMAEEDPRFYALYDKNFRKFLGPLETVNQ